jgi:tetratricopeptide (TPR) repeat protein
VRFRPFLYFIPLLWLASCSTKRNTIVSRGFHDLTAHYNGYYYSCESIRDGVYKIEKNAKENYDKLLPVYVYAPPDKVKNTFPEFDKAIKKSSLSIQRHTITDSKGKEVPSAGHWIDNNWINIGIAHFYKREYFSAIEAFEYVIRTYTKSDDKYTAMIWLVKANNEIGSISAAETVLSLLKNEKKLPLSVKRELPVVYADYYMRRGQISEATAKLMQVARDRGLFTRVDKKRRARFSFIIAQLAEQNRENKRAIQYYQRTIGLKPGYEMMFYSKIKMARLIDVTKNDPEKTKKDLLKMTRDAKNADYNDVIFYTLGGIAEKEKDIPQALLYYRRSVQTSSTNPSQKALSYLKMGEINFDLANYPPAEAYYDSAVVALPNDHPEYNSILARKKTLETLVGYIKTIRREDSLQHIAGMSEKDRFAYVDKMIERMKADELRLKKEKELAGQKNTGAGNTNTLGGVPDNFGNQGATFYFYNPNTVAMGVAEFTKKWGNRPLEDNWRRSNKAIVMDDGSSAGNEKEEKPDSTGSMVKDREYYLSQLPLNDTLIEKSHAKVSRAYYQMGILYKEEINNPVKSIATFEELLKRYPSGKYTLNSYYFLYRLFLAIKNQPKADYYKEKILGEFPESEFALLIRNPAAAEEINAQKSEVESTYAETYRTYAAEDFPKALEQSNAAIAKFGKNVYRPKFEFIRAVSIGKLNGPDTLEKYLKLLTAKYPDADVSAFAKDILESIKNMRNPPAPADTIKKAELDTFQMKPDAEHFIAAVVPDDSRVADGFRSGLTAFNSTYYSQKPLTISGSLFGTKQLIVIRSFTDAKDVMGYYQNLSTDQDVFKGNVKRELIELLPISKENLQLLYTKQNVQSYKLFFEDNYKKKN